MKVLVVHNRYRSALPSGENRVVDDEIAALRRAGVHVEAFLRSSDEFDTMGWSERVAAAVGPITGGPSRKRFRAMLANSRPDVVHLHNPYPLISPAIIDACTDAGVPVVATIHNFRLRCMNGLFYRDGAICTECEERRVPWPGVRHGCYRDSRLQSVVMAGALTVHRRSWDAVARFIAVSDFVSDRLRSWGVPPERVSVKPNSVEDPGLPTETGDGFLFAGRLAPEKGIALLLDAWAGSSLDGRSRLVIAGDGPLRDDVTARCRKLRSVEVVGPQTPRGVDHLRRSTSVAVMPSLGFETHGAIAESFAHARPVVATRVGALASLVDDSVGWSADPDVGSLGLVLREAAESGEARRRGIAARQRYGERYRPEIVTPQLIAVYEDVSAS